MPITPPKVTRDGKGPGLGPGLLAVLAMTALAFLAFAPLGRGERVASVPYSAVKSLIRDGFVVEAVLEEHAVEILRPPSGPSVEGVADDVRRLRAVTPSQGDPELLPLLEDAGAEVVARPPQRTSLITWLLPWVLIVLVWIWLQRRMTGGFGGGLSPGGPHGLFRGRFSAPVERRSKITFDDVAGQEGPKREVAELVEFLREPERFSRVGAEVPHGVLLTGPPGTGKTLLAKALAGEADVPFFSTSASEFVEVFVGVGAGRVRRMFEEARKVAPAVIFIDELDSVGRARGAGFGGGHDEREQTLNQILAELDGFEGKEAVVVLAATNRPDVLDPALLRPGRFDRHVALELPGKDARRAILDIHAANLPLAEPDDLDDVAAGTPGFSGADLANLLNEAAISAARRHDDEILADDLQEARDKVMMGTVRTLAVKPDERRRLAVHEAGHTAAAFWLPGADPLYKVTVIPRGRTLGGTHMLEEQERHTLDEDHLRTTLSILLAGRAAERALLGTVSSGADDDIRRATALARSMVARWGMTEALGPVDLREQDEHPFLGRSMAQPRAHAEATAAMVDAQVIALLKGAEADATALLDAHRTEVEALVDALEAHETLDFPSIAACLDPTPAAEARTP